jgi:hypothetical protein
MAKIPLGDIDRYQDESSVEKIKRKPGKDVSKKHKKTKRDKSLN